MKSQGAPLFPMVGSGTFGETAIVADTAAVKIPKHFDLKLAKKFGATATVNAIRTIPSRSCSTSPTGGPPTWRSR